MIRRAGSEKRISASRKQSNLVGNIRLDIKKGKRFSKGIPIHEVLRDAEAKLFELRGSRSFPPLSASRKQSNLVGHIRVDIKKGKLFSKGVPIHEVLREAEAKLFELRASEQSITPARPDGATPYAERR